MVCRDIPSKKNQTIIHRAVDEVFLDDESSNAYAIEMGYLKPKVGLGTIMEDTPDHLLILVYLTILTGKNLYFAEFSTKIY